MPNYTENYKLEKPFPQEPYNIDVPNNNMDVVDQLIFEGSQYAKNLESRIARLEESLFNDIVENPFVFAFESLENLRLVKGIWNKEAGKIEC